MTLADAPRYSPTWLQLREGADAEARAAELLDPLRRHVVGRGTVGAGTAGTGTAGTGAAGTGAAGTGAAGTGTAGAPSLVIRDLGCGTGSMGRWLGVRLPGRQHWIMHDHDPELLEHAAANMVEASADGGSVTVETRTGDITRLSAADLAGTSLVTASALLDLLTSPEVDQLAAACVEAGCAALLTLSVVGRVELEPAEPLDAEIVAAFNDHQGRVVDGRRLLGPDATDATADAFARRGATVHVRPSPWRLDADRAALTAQWLRGWVAAACAQRPELADEADAYLSRRLAAAAAGALRATVHHNDLLVLPAQPGRAAS